MTPQPVTTGHLLNGRIRYQQPAHGHRSGIEPVFLAASVPARAGERVIEAGTGAGAALLCLAHRVPGVVGVGVERDAGLAAIAVANLAANGLRGIDIACMPVEEFSAGIPFDHALANPPWHDEAGTASPDTAREAAKRADPGLAGRWIALLASALRHHGTLTLVSAVAVLPRWLAMLPEAGCGSPEIWPLWPRAGTGAKLALLRAMRGGRSPLRLHPGMALHAPDGSFTPEAEAILRDAAAFPSA